MTYAPNGDPLTANDLVNGNWTYAYDYFNRLKTAAKSGLGLSYTYDRYGNRWKQTVTPPGTDSPSFSFTGGNNRIDQLCHDAAGNVLDDRTFTPGPCPADLNSVRFKFDAESRLISVDGGATGSYVYDAEGRRVRRVEQGTVRNYVYDLADRAITEIGGAGSWVRGEIYAGGRHLGTYVDGKTYFAHSDWLGTERLRSRLIGTEKERFTSWPFGDHLESSGGNSSTLHFTGKERDAESGLDFFEARYYGSNLGRFLEPDEFSGGPVDAFGGDPAPPGPLPYADITNPQSLNRYSYTYNSPLRFTDPDGHDVWSKLGETIGGIVNAVNENNGFHSSDPLPENSLGRAIGNGISVIQGTVEVIGGGSAAAAGATEAVVTSPAAATGIGIALPAAGAVTTVAGAGVAVHGATVIGNAINNMKAGSAGGPGSGSRAAPAQRERAIQENRGKCVVPGCKNPANSVDHAIPRSRNGNNRPDNLQGMCIHHNCQKGTKTSAEYEVWRKKHPEKK